MISSLAKACVHLCISLMTVKLIYAVNHAGSVAGLSAWAFRLAGAELGGLGQQAASKIPRPSSLTTVKVMLDIYQASSYFAGWDEGGVSSRLKPKRRAQVSSQNEIPQLGSGK
jgi:hypothetical protein